MEIIIENADTIVLVKDFTTNIYDQQLVGNVVLMHKGTKFFCDSAVKYGSDNTMESFYNVQIIQGDSLHLTSDYIKFSNRTQQILAKDTVMLRHNEVRLFTDYLTYNLDTKVATYQDSGRIVDKENTIHSERGIYRANQSEVMFYKDVNIINPEYTIEADSIRYFTDTKIAHLISPTKIVSDSVEIYAEQGQYNTATNVAMLSHHIKVIQPPYILTGDSVYYEKATEISEVFQNAFLTDTVGSFSISGNYMYLSRPENIAIVTDSALLITINEHDSTFTHADTIYFTKDDSGYNKIHSYHHVQFFQNSLQGKCDSMVFTFVDSTLWMYDLPVLWVEKNQLFGDTIAVLFKQKKIDELYLFPNAFIVNKEAESRFNQLKGRKVKGEFYENELRNIHVFGNGESIYYPKDDDKYLGINHVRSSKVRIDFKEKDISQIAFIGSPSGSLHPLEDSNKIKLFLDGFKWLEALRPTDRYDIFRWKEASKAPLKVKKQLSNFP